MIEQLIKDGFEPIKGNENYLISRNGDIYSIDKMKFILPNDSQEYAVVRVNKKSVQVHRLVAIQFIENPHNKNVVNHIDANKRNNHVSNLEWATQGENISHRHRHYKEFKHIYERELSPRQMRDVCDHLFKMQDFKVAKMFNLSPNNLWRIKRYFEYYKRKKYPCIPCDNEVKFLS